MRQIAKTVGEIGVDALNGLFVAEISVFTVRDFAHQEITDLVEAICADKIIR